MLSAAAAAAVVSRNLVTLLRSDKNDITIFFLFYFFYVSGFSPSLSCASFFWKREIFLRDEGENFSDNQTGCVPNL